MLLHNRKPFPQNKATVSRVDIMKKAANKRHFDKHLQVQSPPDLWPGDIILPEVGPLEMTIQPHNGLEPFFMVWYDWDPGWPLLTELKAVTTLLSALLTATTSGPNT